MSEWCFWIFLNFFAIFLGIFYPGSSRNRIRNNFFFFLSYSAYLSTVWIKILPEWCFLIFWIFFGFLYPRSGRNGIWMEIFFFLFLSLSKLSFDRNNARVMFYNSLIFFWEFSIAGRVGTEFGMKILFPSFMAYLNPGWI